MSVATDITEGRLVPETLDKQVLEECRKLFGFVDGPGDPLWELQVEVARGVLALDGIPVNELAEWVITSRQRQGLDAPDEVEAPPGVDDEPSDAEDGE